MYNYFESWGYGGIGRHARLKIWFFSESIGSSPITPTKIGTFQEWKCVNVCVSKFETPTHIDLQRDGMDSKFIVFYK